MKTLKVPPRLRLSSFLILLSIPLVALQTVIASRAPWWDLPIKSMQIWSLSVALMSFPLSIWIVNGKRWAYHVTKVFAISWCLLSIAIAIELSHFWLNVFVLCLVVFWILTLNRIRFEMDPCGSIWAHIKIGKSYMAG